MPDFPCRRWLKEASQSAEGTRFGKGGKYIDNQTVPFSDLTLARRLERAEGHACAQYAVARRRLFPGSGAEWMECAGTYAVFDGIASPVTQTFGLGIFEPLRPSTLDVIERFFLDREAPVNHEVSPLAGVAALNLLCTRNYRPIELSNVLYRPVEPPAAVSDSRIRVHVIGREEAHLWARIHASAWSHEHPELADFLLESGAISAAREQNLCFLAEVEGTPGAAGVLCIHDGIALFAGSATIPELRRRGLHRALLDERMRHAFDHGCDLAMMVTEAGSDSQRNAENKGFRIAYTRTKWRLSS
jgi:ribosomal protein S18 acetylase RimI-like enzyme